MEERGFCSHCGKKITSDGDFCPNCGKPFKEEKANSVSQDKIVINNIVSATANANAVIRVGRAINKWVSLLLCFFLGFFGLHKFYEGKIGMGILYILTAGLFGIGWLVDIFVILCKPNPYYV